MLSRLHVLCQGIATVVGLGKEVSPSVERRHVYLETPVTVCSCYGSSHLAVLVYLSLHEYVSPCPATYKRRAVTVTLVIVGIRIFSRVTNNCIPILRHYRRVNGINGSISFFIHLVGYGAGFLAYSCQIFIFQYIGLGWYCIYCSLKGQSLFRLISQLLCTLIPAPSLYLHQQVEV